MSKAILLKIRGALFLCLLILVPILMDSCGDKEDPCPDITINDQQFDVDENSPDGTLVGKVVSSFAVESFSITSGNDGNAFSIDPDGSIKVSSSTSIDYEVVQIFTLDIQVTTEDCGTTSLTANVIVNDLNDEIYRDPVFSNIRIDENVVYGESAPDEQIMKVYVPEDNTSKRPLLVIAVGLGQAFSFLEDIGNTLSRAGYVVATIGYHTDSTDPLIRNIIAAQDLRAAIRYFRRDVAEDDVYKIDTNNVFAGGFGFGAFTAHRMAYPDETDLSPETLEVIEANGGFEGDRGNAGYSSEFKALVTMSGGIDDLLYIDEGESPIISIHHVDDSEVPCENGEFNNGDPYSGSCSIIERAEEVGIESRLILMSNSTNDNHDAPAFCTECYDEVLAFFSQFLE